jgi:DNA polymerase
MNIENLILELKERCNNCFLCDLSKSRNKVVFGKGNINAQIMLIGEAPGKNEDLEGYPFVGRAGENLNKMLNVIDLNLDDIYVANILKCRPPKNRDPSFDEIKKCTPYLIEQIKLIRPKIVATLGNYATKFVLSDFDLEKMKKIDGVSKLHGQVFEKKLGDFEYLVIPIYHPAAIIYRPFLKEEFEKDFKIMKNIISTKI